MNGLADSTTYYFSVRAYDAVGDLSAFSAEVSTTTPTKTRLTGTNPACYVAVVKRNLNLLLTNALLLTSAAVGF